MGSNIETNNVRDEILESIHDKKKKLINVYAGPGSGKSTLIAEIIKKYLTETDYGLNNFLCLSYTNESWKELLDKIAQKCNLIMNFDHLNITTFHKYCAALINKENELDKKTNEDLKNLSRKEIEEYKKKAIDDLIEDATNELDVYHYSNGERGAINKNLLTEKKVLFLDEAQDLKEDTCRFLESLLRASKNKIKVYAFSDPDQGIFEYGGSDHKLISKLMKKGKTYELTNNYRSCEKLVEFTEKYRNASFKSLRKQDMHSESGKKGSKDAVRCIKVSDNNYYNSIVQAVKTYASKIKEDCSIGVIVPKSEEAHNIYEILAHEYIASANIIVKTTGISYTSFNLCRLDEFHSLFCSLYEAFAKYAEIHKRNFIETDETGSYFIDPKIYYASFNNRLDVRNEYNLKAVLRKFKDAYKKSVYSKAVIAFFKDFRTIYRNEYYKNHTENPDDKKTNKKLFYSTEFIEFMKYTSNYTFDEFYNDYIIKTPIKADTTKIEITVSTIHKSKGHEYDTVFMACLNKDKDWLNNGLNKTHTYVFEKCRYVAMTRAKKELVIFNDVEESNYCEFKSKNSNTKVVLDCQNSILLTPHDLALSFASYSYSSYTQWKPNEYHKSEESDPAFYMTFFDESPAYIQAGAKLHLENVQSYEGVDRFVFSAEFGKNTFISVERLSSTARNETGDNPLGELVRKYHEIRNNFIIENKVVDINDEHHTYRKDISEIFTQWCENNLEIRVGAVMIINDISAPWIENGKFHEERIQDRRYYEWDGKNETVFLRADILKSNLEKDYYKLQVRESFWDDLRAKKVSGFLKKPDFYKDNNGKLDFKKYNIIVNSMCDGSDRNTHIIVCKNYKECDDVFYINAERNGLCKKLILPKISYKKDNNRK